MILKLRERHLTDEEIMDLLDGDVEAQVEVFEKFGVGEYYANTYCGPRSQSIRESHVDALRDAGLDIGKGDSRFGYKMPVPEKDSQDRELIIFRRN